MYLSLNGVLLLNKPRGMTSHDCVLRLRRLLQTKKIGHTGTLDPEVDGVLPICVGSATKLVPFLTADVKEYVGEVTLGFSTTTEDASGEEVERRAIAERVTVEQVKKVLQGMLGTQVQMPPMYSAVKVNGKKLYEYARAGLEAERPEREVTIYELDLLDDVHQHDDLVHFCFRICGSKGIFIRTVAVTIGERLGYPAHMSDLTRIRSGNFRLEECVTLEQVEAGDFKLLTVSEALQDFPCVRVESWVEKLVRNGVKLREEQIKPEMKERSFLICNEEDVPLSIHEWDQEKQLYVAVRGLW